MPLTTTHAEYRRLANLRRRARNHDLILRSSRKPKSRWNRGGFMLVDGIFDSVIAGDTFNLSLSEAEAAVAHEIALQEIGDSDCSIPF